MQSLCQTIQRNSVMINFRSCCLLNIKTKTQTTPPFNWNYNYHDDRIARQTTCVFVCILIDFQFKFPLLIISYNHFMHFCFKYKFSWNDFLASLESEINFAIVFFRMVEPTQSYHPYAIWNFFFIIKWVNHKLVEPTKCNYSSSFRCVLIESYTPRELLHVRLCKSLADLFSRMYTFVYLFIGTLSRL